MDAHADTSPELPWILVALIMLGLVGVGRAAQDGSWAVVGITGVGVLGFAVILLLVLLRRRRITSNG